MHGMTPRLRREIRQIVFDHFDDIVEEPGSVTVFGADVWKSPVFPVRTTFQWQQC